MNRKYLNIKTECQWCKTEFQYRKGKKFCCDSCRAFFNLNKKNTIKIERAKFIKRLPDVRFKGYLKLIQEYNQLYKRSQKGEKIKNLEKIYSLLKSQNVKNHVPEIKKYLAQQK